MRYDPNHKRRTRDRVLKEAATSLRERGAHQLSLVDVMKRAGLTHGGFYNHFPSRDALLAATIEQMFAESYKALGCPNGEAKGAEKTLHRFINFYLSADHRDNRTEGCPIPFLSADAERLAEPVRARLTGGIAQLKDRLAKLIDAIGIPDPSAEAHSLLSELVGALILSRAEQTHEVSDEILECSRLALLRRLGLSSTDQDQA